MKFVLILFAAVACQAKSIESNLRRFPYLQFHNSQVSADVPVLFPALDRSLYAITTLSVDKTQLSHLKAWSVFNDELQAAAFRIETSFKTAAATTEDQELKAYLNAMSSYPLKLMVMYRNQGSFTPSIGNDDILESHVTIGKYEAKILQLEGKSDEEIQTIVTDLVRKRAAAYVARLVEIDNKLIDALPAIYSPIHDMIAANEASYTVETARSICYQFSDKYFVVVDSYRKKQNALLPSRAFTTRTNFD